MTHRLSPCRLPGRSPFALTSLGQLAPVLTLIAFLFFSIPASGNGKWSLAIEWCPPFNRPIGLFSQVPELACNRRSTTRHHVPYGFPPTLLSVARTSLFTCFFYLVLWAGGMATTPPPASPLIID